MSDLEDENRVSMRFISEGRRDGTKFEGVMTYMGGLPDLEGVGEVEERKEVGSLCTQVM